MSTHHGWLNIYKEKGVSSFAVVAQVRKLLNIKKVGHGGTLDPLAEGILPIAVGEATKTAGLTLDGNKTYEFTIQFGFETNSGDLEGEMTQQLDVMPSKVDIEKTLPYFTGNIKQTPPKYSAIRINGKRAYKLARAGKDVTLPERDVTICSLRLLEIDTKQKQARFEAVVSKGTYIRTLAQDIAKKAGGLGHVIQLIRTKHNIFEKKDAFLLENLKEMVQKAAPATWLQPVDAVLGDIPVMHLDTEMEKTFRHGNGFLYKSQAADLVRVYANDQCIGLAKTDGVMLQPTRVFNI